MMVIIDFAVLLVGLVLLFRRAFSSTASLTVTSALRNRRSEELSDREQLDCDHRIDLTLRGNLDVREIGFALFQDAILPYLLQ